MAADNVPIPMILHCPRCGRQHIDEPETDDECKAFTQPPTPWTNPPHRTHFCKACGHLWRPSLLNTEGVKELPDA